MILLLAATLIAQAAPSELRLGLFIGNDEGLSSEQRLLFATSDARKMRDLFVNWGEMRQSDTVLLTDEPRRRVERALQDIRGRVAGAQDVGQPTTLVVYYSGHGDERSLHLGTSQIAHQELRQWLDDTGADVRIAILDACQSGSAIRQKGGQRGPSFDFALEVERTRGSAILTSSAASELSQESSQVGGGFFTYYLHSGLLGAADSDRDGVVTLTEAYSYVHAETAFGTRDTPDHQTPGFEFDLAGSGDIVLTSLEQATSYLSFLGGLDGTFAIWDETRKRYVAEVDGASPHKLAVKPGLYYVHRRHPGWVDEGEYHVRRGETRTVLDEDMVAVSYENTAAKGDLRRQERRASLPDLMLRGVVGARGFGNNSIWTARYVPPHVVAGLELRFLSRRGPTFSFDLLSGGGSGSLDFEALGSKQVNVSSTSLAATAGFATKPRLIRAGLGGRAEIIGFRRSFPFGEIKPQATFSVSPGVNSWLGLHHGRMSLDLQLNVLLLATQWDGKMPIYNELLLAMGYRF